MNQGSASGRAYINGIGIAVPPLEIGQAEACEMLLARFGDSLRPESLSLMKKIFAHPGIGHRRFALDDPRELFGEDPDARIARFTEQSLALGGKAVLDALSRCGKGVDDIFALVVNTCTGYVCPGISTYLIERLGLRRDIKAFDLAGSGCGGAVPNLQLAESLLASTAEGRDGVVMSLSVEICSATFQMSDDWGLIVSNALFGDGAAAAVISRMPAGLAIMDFENRYAPEDREHIRYVYKGGQLHNQLSPQLPALVPKTVGRVVGDLLGRSSLTTGDIRHWALHTGGEKIIASIEKELGLSAEETGTTRAVMARYGNMSSPTVLFVLQELMARGMEPGEWCLMAAFGAGLSAHAALLRKA